MDDFDFATASRDYSKGTRRELQGIPSASARLRDASTSWTICLWQRNAASEGVFRRDTHGESARAALCARLGSHTRRFFTVFLHSPRLGPESKEGRESRLGSAI